MRRIIFIILAVIVLAFVGIYTKSLKPKEIKEQLKQITKVTINKPSQESSSSAQVVAKNLDVPWAITFLPSGNMLVTERPGNVKEIDKNGNAKIIFEVPDVKPEGEGGLHGITLHPDFEKNSYVYLYYTYNPNPTKNKVVRYKYQNGALTQDKVIIDNIPGSIFHNGGRIRFGPGKQLYVTTGDAQEPSIAQDQNALGGKILRLTPDGAPATGNPFGNEIYSYGHRNPQGIAWDSSGTLWQSEHGPSGIGPSCCRDEVNIIKAGQNYGWPDITGDQSKSGMQTPTATSGSSKTWAPGNIAIAEGKVFFAGLRGTDIYMFDPKNPSEVKSLYNGKYGRIRELIVGPDGFLYFSTSNRDGRGNPQPEDDKIIKIDPKSF